MTQPIPQTFPALVSTAGGYLRNGAPALGLGVHAVEQAIQYIAARRRVCSAAQIVDEAIGTASPAAGPPPVGYYAQRIYMPAHARYGLVRIACTASGTVSVTLGLATAIDSWSSSKSLTADSSTEIVAIVGLRASTAAEAPETQIVTLTVSATSTGARLSSWSIDVLGEDEL